VNNKYKVTKFIEKPNLEKAKKIIKKNAYWNSGMFFLTKKSIINNFQEVPKQKL
jgi:mannose-1-phosphate guanylyltransferase